MEIAEIGEITKHSGTTEFFSVHVVGRDPMRVETLATAAVEEILERAGVTVLPDHHIFLGECVDSLSLIEVEDGEDGHEPVDHRHSPHQYGHRGGHIHCHSCRRIKAIVIYNGDEKTHRFSPSTTIETVLTWAAKKFKINPIDAEKLVLKISGSGDSPLKPDTHVGDLVKPDSHCALALELVPDDGRVNG
jgi:hypothetical protein